VPDPRRGELLAGTRDLVVLVRLSVDPRQRVLHGEVVDPDTWRSQPFRGLAGVPGALEAWITATLGPEPRPDDDPGVIEPGVRAANPTP